MHLVKGGGGWGCYAKPCASFFSSLEISCWSSHSFFLGFMNFLSYTFFHLC